MIRRRREGWGKRDCKVRKAGKKEKRELSGLKVRERWEEREMGISGIENQGQKGISGMKSQG